MNLQISLLVLSSCLGFSYSVISGMALGTIRSTTLEIIADNALDKECALDLKTVVSEASELKLWALRMLDASAKLYPGVLEGHTYMFGDFDQCLSISENIEGREIKGQYCTASLTSKYETELRIRRIKFGGVFDVLSNSSITLGICLPKSCSVRNAGQILHSVEKKFGLPFQAEIIDDSCVHRDKPVDIHGLDIFIYFLFTAYYFFLTCVTIYDIYTTYFGLAPRLVVIFSLYNNLKRLFSQRPNNHNTITCLNGIKVISSFWIIFAQMAFLVMYISQNPLYFMTEWPQQSSNAFIWAAAYAIDTYFTISGVLISYIYLKHCEKFSVGIRSYFFNRILRIKPAVVATILIHVSGLKLLADGPFGQFILNNYSRNCSKSWWTVFFYFSNFWNYKECAPHTWHVSVDTRMYLCSPVIIFFMKKYPRRVAGVGVLAFIFAVSYTSMITMHKRIGYTMFDWNEDFQDYIFYSVFTRLPSWLIGVFFGYCIHYKKFNFSNVVNVVLWTVSLTAMLKLILNQTVFIGTEYCAYRAALWNGLSRPTWSLALCFIIYSCATGRGGLVNRFLSHRVFRVLSKLTYSMNLTSFSVLLVYIFNTKETFYFANFELISMFLFVIFIVLMCSTVLYLGYEAPLVSLKDFVEKRQDKKSSTKMT